jgi:hypothetical protein
MTDEDDDETRERSVPSLHKQRRAAGEVALTERDGRMAEIMVFGLDAPSNRLPEVAEPRGRSDGARSEAAQCEADFCDAGLQKDAQREDS